jgi:hypothetical protein
MTAMGNAEAAVASGGTRWKRLYRRNSPVALVIPALGGFNESGKAPVPASIDPAPRTFRSYLPLT